MLSNAFLASANNISQNWSKFVFHFNHVIKLVNEGQILTNPGRLTFWGSENPLPISVFTYYSFQIKLSSFWKVSQPKFHIGKNDDKVGNKTKKENKKGGSKLICRKRSKFWLKCKGTKKKKNKSELFTSQKYFPIPIHFYANLWKTSPTTKIIC